MNKNNFRIFLSVLLIVAMPFPSYADYGPIQIDGYYDDWEDKPHTEVYPGNNPAESKINDVSLFRDEANVYVHVVFAQKNNQDITNMTIDLDTNLGGENYSVVLDDVIDEMDTLDPEPPLEEQTPEIPEITETPEIIETPETNEQGSDPEQGDGAESIDQTSDTNEENLFAGSDQQSILLVAEEEGNLEEVGEGNGEADTADQTSDPDIDLSPNEDLNSENPEDMLDLLNPDNFADPDVILDQFVPEITSGSGIEMGEPDPGLNSKKSELYGTWAFTVYDEQSSVGYGYYTRTEGEADELELFIPLSSITDQYDGITEISMKIKKLGPQIIICTGASAGPYIGVAIGAGIAMLSVGAYSYKKKSKGRAH